VRTPNPARVYQQLLDHRPHLDGDELFLHQKLGFYRDWLEASYSANAPLWSNEENLALEAVPADIKVPVLIIAGFDDPFLRSSLALHAHLGSKADSLLALIPTNHIGQQSGDVQVDGVDGLYTFRLPVPWLLHHLQGAPLPFEASGVKVWARGATKPRVAADWPGQTVEQRLVLQPDVVTTEPCEQRRLGGEAGTPSLLSYRYNPMNPWRSEGGARGIAFIFAGGVKPGPVTQSWACRRDVVRFVGERLTAPTRLVGSMTLELAVRSSALDTAFVAKLVDIDEHGRAVHLTDGAATLLQPTGDPRDAVPYERQTVRSLRIDFWPTEWVLAPGHRLGLWVSSSNYPMFSAHLNTDKPWFTETSPVLAEQTLELGGPSALVLRTLP
jgi:putative CocE/NonD family hydrolase